MITWFGNFLLNYSKLILGTIVAITLILAFFVPRIEYVSSVQELYPSHKHPARQVFEQVEATFGEEASLIVVISNDDIFQPATLEKLRELSDTLESLPFVAEVEGLARSTRIISTEDEMRGENFLDTVPKTPEAVEALRQEYFEHPLYGGAYVTPDSRSTLINIIFKPNEEIGFVPPLVQQIHDIAASYEDPEEIYVMGFREMNTQFNNIMQRDRTRATPIIIIVMIIMLYLNFRSLIGFLLPMTSVAIGVVWALGIMSLLGIPISILTSTIPTVMAAIGTAYGIYFVSAYFDLSQQLEDPELLIRRALSKTTLALLFCGLTTAIGFFVLSLNEIHLIQEMGRAASIGIACLMIVTLMFLPLLFLIVGTVQIKKGRQLRKAVRVKRHRRIEHIPQWLIKRSGLVLLVAAGLLAASAYSATQLKIDNDPSTFFWRSSETWKNLHHLQNNLNRYNQYAIVLVGDDANVFKQPELLRDIENLQREIDAWPAVGDSMSLADFVKTVNKSFNENNPDFARIPDTAAEVGQYLLLFSVAGDVEDIHRYVTEDYRASQIRINSGTSSSEASWQLVRRLKNACEQTFGDRLTCQVTGSGLMYAISAQSMAMGVFKGVSVALAVMLVLMIFLFRSLKIALLSMIPNILPSLMLLGVMGLSGIPMNYGTSIILTIALGIAVDDTLHFFVHYYQELKQTNHFLIRSQTGIPITDDQRWSVVETWRQLYKPVTTTSMTLAGGFLVLVLSDLVPLVLFGILLALTMMFAVLADLIVTPCLLARTRF